MYTLTTYTLKLIKKPLYIEHYRKFLSLSGKNGSLRWIISVGNKMYKSLQHKRQQHTFSADINS